MNNQKVLLNLQFIALLALLPRCNNYPARVFHSNLPEVHSDNTAWVLHSSLPGLLLHSMASGSPPDMVSHNSFLQLFRCRMSLLPGKPHNLNLKPDKHRLQRSSSQAPLVRSS
jgi:hypothetical protein